MRSPSTSPVFVLATLLAATTTTLSACVDHEGGKGADSAGAAPESSPSDADSGQSDDAGTVPTTCEALGLVVVYPEGYDCGEEGDTDCDGLLDTAEAFLGSDPTHPDSDGDCLPDGMELKVTQTHPLCADTDGDGLGDGDEVLDGSSPLAPTDPLETETPTPACDPTLASSLIDLDDDPDADLLSSREDLLCGADPQNPDTDGDALGDRDECAWFCSPTEVDTDNDGLSDKDEVDLGLSCTQDDTDNDALLDGLELDNDCDPKMIDTDGDGIDDYAEIMVHSTLCNEPDTDGDGLDDGSEIALTESGSVSDPLDADSRADVIAPDEKAQCTDASKVTAYNFGSSAFYAGAETSIGETTIGPECQCTFPVYSVPQRTVLGVTVFADQSIHDGTDWEDDPKPRGVLLAADAWSWLDTQAGTDLDFVLSEPSGTLREADGYWAAFDESMGITTDPTTSEEPADITDTVTIRVSYANTSGDRIGDDCSVLDESVSDDGLVRTPGLQFEISTDALETTGMPAFEPPGSDRACSAPASGDRYALVPGREGIVPVPLGPARPGGAALTRVEVADWHGAERLRLRTGDGQERVVTPAAPVAHFDPPAPLSAVDWSASRQSDGSWRAPEVLLSTACLPAELAAPPPAVPVYAAGWLHVQSLLSTAGLPAALAERWPDAPADDRDALRVRVVPAPIGAAPVVPAFLRLDAAGTGTLRYLPLSRSLAHQAMAAEAGALESWGVAWTIDGVQVSGSLLRTASALVLQVDALSVAGLAVPLETSLTLSFDSQ